MEKRIRDGHSIFTQYLLANDGPEAIAVAHKTETGSEAITQLAGQLQSIVPIVFAMAIALTEAVGRKMYSLVSF